VDSTNESQAVEWVDVNEVLERLIHDEEKGVFATMLTHHLDPR
jgi:hypothetical protein